MKITEAKTTKRTVVLVNPNNLGSYVQGRFAREHLGLGYLTAELKAKKFDAHIIDSRILAHTPKEATTEILKLKPKIVGFSVIAKTATEWTSQVSQIIKKKDPNIHIVLGNYFPTLQPDRAFEDIPEADSIVIREGDITLVKLAQKIFSQKKWFQLNGIAYKKNKQIQINFPQKLIRNLDSLPSPEHTAQKYGLSEFAIEGSRGCYCRCTFCSSGPFFDKGGNNNPRRRSRSAKSMAREIEINLKKFPRIKTFRFTDLDFIGSASPKDTERLENIAKELAKIKTKFDKFEFIFATRVEVVNAIPKKLWQKLKTAGLKEVYIGIETATPFIKKMMAKASTFRDNMKAIQILESAGIFPRYGFMMITPWTKTKDIQINARALSRIGFPRIDKYFQEMYLVPGTKAVELTKKFAKIWFDQNGKGEYYTYKLPPTINNLRRIGRAMTKVDSDFLSLHQSLHEKIGKALKTSSIATRTEEFKRQLNKFTLDFFLSTFETARKTKNKATNKTIEKNARKIALKYLPLLTIINTDFDSIYSKKTP